MIDGPAINAVYSCMGGLRHIRYSLRTYIVPALGLFAGFTAMPSHAIDCSPSSARALFSYEGQTQTVLDVEAAMARAQASLGVIPQAAAADISAKARVELVPRTAFDEEYGKVRHRMVALLNVWRESLGPEGDQFVHFGATTVDIYGTATILQLDQAIAQLDLCAAESMTMMARLARDHQATTMIGRTLGQHAQPITFGKKVSTWIAEFARHRQRLAQLRERLRKSAILKGPVGNYSGLGDKAIAIEQRFASELGLDQPYFADWNGTRDVLAEYGAVLALIAKSHQRIGQEIFLLQGTDIAEVRESLPQGTVGSSSMPHKRNPRIPERLVQAGRTIPRLSEVLSDDIVNLFERDNTSRMTPVIEDITIESVAAMRNLSLLLDGLEVDAEQMFANIGKTQGFAMSQRVALALARAMPRTEADALVKSVIASALDSQVDFASALLAEPRVTAVLSQEDIVNLLDPTFVGQPALEQIDAAIERAEFEAAARHD